MKFGCFYNKNPSPGRCIKDTRSDVVEKECEISNNACKLKALPPLRSPKTVTKETHKNREKLSGPVSAYVTEYENKSFNFFGDAHFSMSGKCSPCQDINLQNLKINVPEESEDCWDISVLLSKTFTEASEKGVWVDFYIELPFLPVKEYRPSSKDIFSNIDTAGYLYKLYYIFYNCLNKLGCKYDTTRFHYVDVRLEFHKVDLPKITSELEKLLTLTGETRPEFSTGMNNYEMYISTKRVLNSLKKLRKMAVTNDKTKNPYIEETDKLMRDLYFSGGQTMQGKVEAKNIRLFELYLTSDNFAEDVQNLMKDSLINIQNTEEVLKLIKVLVPPTMLVNRRGKNMHRVRAQLEALENEGQGKIAELIKNFIMDKYRKNSNINKIIDLWRGIMITYEGFINAKYRSLNDVNTLIEKFQKEMRSLEELLMFSVSSIALLMDAYTLARMFRKYSGKNHIESVKSIVYAGEAHISTYVNFFEEILKTKFIKYEPNKMVFETKNYDKLRRCFDVNLKDFSL